MTDNRPKANRVHKFSAHIGYLFTERSLPERFAAARRQGFAAVEHPDLYDQNATEIARLLKQNGLAFAWTNLPIGDRAKGERGLACLPGDTDRYVDGLERCLNLAEAIGCPLIHPMAGVRPEGVPESKLWETYIQNMALAADAAAKLGIIVVIEPLGEAAISGYFMNSHETAVRAISELGRSNVRVLLDVYHSLNCGQDPLEFIRSHGDLLAHVHIADLPGRHEPGTGKIDFEELYRTLDDAGYSAFIGCEYIPAGETEAGLTWMPRQNRQ